MRLRFRHRVNDTVARAQPVRDARVLRKTQLHEQLRIALDTLSTLKERALKHPGWYDEPIARAKKQVDELERQLFIVQDKALSATIASAEQPHSARLAALNKKNAEFWTRKDTVDDTALSATIASAGQPHSVRLAALNKKNAEFWNRRTE